MSDTHPDARRRSKHFLARDRDGNAKVRMKFSSEEAAVMEEAAGDVPIVLWMHRALHREAQRQAKAKRRKLASMPPPE